MTAIRHINSLLQGCLAVCMVFGLVGAGCTPSPTQTPLAGEIILYNWVDYMPQSVLDAFTAEYGVKVKYTTYETMDEAVQNIGDGLAFDVAVVEHDLILELSASGLLAELDYRNIPNFKNISADFRDLSFDPDDKHSVPYSWGTTGLLVRTDLVADPPTHWVDLWENKYPGKIAVRPEPVELISVALKALGYRLNSENPEELEAALQHLLALKPSLIFVASDTTAVDALLNGEVSILLAWPGDALYAQGQSAATQYIMPEEGTMLWGDRFVVSRNSQNKYTAEVFLNFLLRPEIAGQIVNENQYAIANDQAIPYIDPAILGNPILYPVDLEINNFDWYLPLSPAGQKLYADIWARFITDER
ncbi:MAG: spermidine/putrescine ABC transporter substrate-binding protein [Chloroflexi bacterium]|nr:spermidine/putrescine ABC transporter substrate-binding protein [Chloroflexota bacterium]